MNKKILPALFVLAFLPLQVNANQMYSNGMQRGALVIIAIVFIAVAYWIFSKEIKFLAKVHPILRTIVKILLVLALGGVFSIAAVFAGYILFMLIAVLFSL